MAGEHTRRARTTPSAKKSIGHSSITDENKDAQPERNREQCGAILVAGSWDTLTSPLALSLLRARVPEDIQRPKFTWLKAVSLPGIYLENLEKDRFWHCSAPDEDVI